MVCDYCKQMSIIKVTIHNKFWKLCFDCAMKNRERLDIDYDFLMGLKNDRHTK